MLGEADGASFVWATCFGPSSGISAPMRIEGGAVALPGDGSLYSDDVEAMFPDGLADLILDDPGPLRP